MNKVIKPNWNNFKAKFNDNPQDNFEWFCYLLFCRQFNKPRGIFRYKNQSGIETNPIEIDNEVIGWQAKFYDSTLAKRKYDLVEAIEKSKRDYPNITKIIFYTNQEWGQGKKNNDSKEKSLVENKAKELKIEIVWYTASFFESEFVAINNEDISSHFFCLEESIIDKVYKVIIPRVTELNNQYKKTFSSIDGEFFNRSEINSCIKMLKREESIIIHGKAGAGKSGCTQGIINYCEKENIPYIAVKLDDRIPNCNSEKWGEELGLSVSIEKAINLISEQGNAIIILDQLDALRWTQIHSRQALITCSEIIGRISDINKDRDKKISIVFVCRTYDYENDINIKMLFEDKNQFIEWKKVLVSELDEDVVRKTTGKYYNQLSNKMKSILKIPSNLYIWTRLDKNRINNDYSTANQLIQAWWEQLRKKCAENGVSESDVNNIRKKLVDNIIRRERLYIARKILNTSISEGSIEYLISNGFLVLIDNSLSFSHQSIVDYFLAQEMLDRYFNGQDIIQIIGEKQKQTPQRRYQVQMLLQDIQEYGDKEFIEIGIKMLESESIRFYMKYVFLEVLSQCSDISISIKDFIIKYYNNTLWGSHIIDSVIKGHSLFLDILIEGKILDEWIQNDIYKEKVVGLLISISPNYTKKQVEFINKYLFNSKYKQELNKCLAYDICDDNNDMFELRMEFYNQYPEMIRCYLDLGKSLNINEIRTVRVIELILKNEVKNNRVYNNCDIFLERDNYTIKNAQEILNILLPYIPKYNIDNSYSRWINIYGNSNNIERICVEIIKLSNKSIINANPKRFIEKYCEYMGKNYTIFNEIILDGLEKMPITLSNDVISIIIENFDNIIFDKSSGHENKLNITKLILKKYTLNCDNNILSKLEKKVIYYIDSEAKERYKRRLEFGYAYWSFWGDLQLELLECLPENRLSMKAKDLLKVLKRKFINGTDRYKNLDKVVTGTVTSPINDKKLSNKQWIEILTNKKILNKRKSRWIMTNNKFIESSVESFSSNFKDAVLLEPERFIKLILKIEQNLDDKYIEALFGGIESSTNLNEIPHHLLENIILKYKDSYNSDRYIYLCNILRKEKHGEWSVDILNILKDLAINGLVETNVISINSKEANTFRTLSYNALNCIKGYSAITIGELLFKNKKLYSQFKDVIVRLCNDINPAVKLATLQLLYSIYNIDIEFAKTKILDILNQDYRLIGSPYIPQILLSIYDALKDPIDKILIKNFYSDDEYLIEISSKILATVYIQKQRNKEIILNIENLNDIQVQNIVEISLLYFNNNQYNNKVKELISLYLDNNFKLEFQISRIFYNNLVDIGRDHEFLSNLMKYDMNRTVIHSFVKYIEKNDKNIMCYKDIILSLSINRIKTHLDNISLDEELSKLIIELYDASTQFDNQEMISITNQCLDIWDLMFEKRIGLARMLTKKMLDR